MRIAVALALAIMAACYAPKPRAGIQCGDARACPDGLVCRLSTNTCEVTAGVGDDAALGSDADHLDDAPADAEVILDAPPDAAPIPMATLKQQVVGVNATGSMLTVALPNPPIANDLLVMVGGNPDGQLSSVSGGGVATWTLAVKSITNNNVEIWFGTTDGSSAAVTITRAGANAPNTMWVGEFAHLSATLDQNASLAGSTSPASAGTITTTQQHELLLFAVADGIGNTFGTPTPGIWTAATPVTGSIATTEQVWYRNVGGPGTFSVSVTETSHFWDAGLVSFVRE